MDRRMDKTHNTAFYDGHITSRGLERGHIHTDVSTMSDWSK